MDDRFVLRLRDVGMSGWSVFLLLVPFVSFFICFRLFCAPRGYEITKHRDIAMKVLTWIYWGVIALGVLASAGRR